MLASRKSLLSNFALFFTEIFSLQVSAIWLCPFFHRAATLILFQAARIRLRPPRQCVLFCVILSSRPRYPRFGLRLRHPAMGLTVPCHVKIALTVILPGEDQGRPF